MAPSKPLSHASPGPFVPDERQQQAIAHVFGPTLVLAGAGTGKTTVLTRRIAHLVREGHARPDQILALTYTDNAAREMRERVRAELKGTDVSALRACTFHAYCNELLIANGKKFGVLDDKDLWILLRKRIREMGLRYFVRAANVSEFLDDLLDFMRRCHDELVGPEQYQAYVQRLQSGELPIPRVTKSKHANQIGDEEVLERCQEIASVFNKVEAMLTDSNLGTFSHMITRAYGLLQRDADLRAREQGRARFILVDEFQDANFAQVKILKLLAGAEQNIFAVGDPDQAIYRFRGASSAAFGLFSRHFPGTKLIVLDKNRRSTIPILRCAFSVVDQNPPLFHAGQGERLDYKRKPLQSAREEEAAKEKRHFSSQPVEVVVWRDRELEATDLAGDIRSKKNDSRCDWNDFAVLYRNHLNRDDLVKELAQRNIPFTVENMDVLDTPEVRDVIAALTATIFPSDGASLFRVAALPEFRVDPHALRAAMRSAPKDSGLVAALEKIDNGSAVLKSLAEAKQKILQAKAKSRAALEIVVRHFHLNVASPAIQALLNFVASWEQKAITNTGEPGEFIEYLEYFREARGAICMTSHGEDSVRLMTAHGAKGLEFKHVYIIRASSPSFPCGYREPLVEFPRELRDPDSVAEDAGKELNDQEERRLFYVAMTRARDSLTIYAKQGSGRDSSPPGFVRELLKKSDFSTWLRRRPPGPLQVDMFAGEELVPLAESNTAAWLSLTPNLDLNSSLSATAVESYDTCPLQFKLEREWRMPREAPAPMQYGAAIHRVLKTYYDALRYGRTIPQDELAEMFTTDLAAAGIQDRYQYELYETQGVQQLQGFIAHAQAVGQPDILHTEESFSIRIGTAKVNGRIDRVDRLEGNRVAILDYKTGKPRSQEDADESLQLSIYALAAKDTWGYRAECLAFYNLADNSVISTTRSDIQLEEAKARVEEVATQIAAGKFPANPGHHCWTCPYRNLCPATEKQLPVAPRTSAAGRTN